MLKPFGPKAIVFERAGLGVGFGVGGAKVEVAAIETTSRPLARRR